MASNKNQYDDVYGLTFRDYTDSLFELFYEALLTRLRLNALDPNELFRGKRILDAGSGSGRGSILALRNGALHVTSLDISKINCETCCSRMVENGIPNTRYTVIEASLEDIPFEDGSFDFIWCNGVLQHVVHPSSALSEIIRVLKVGGKGWLYVYGASGFYWRLIKEFRELFAGSSTRELIDRLNYLQIPKDRIAEAIDDWKSPCLRVYQERDIEESLLNLKCQSVRLWRGMPYDTSEQLYQGANASLVGVGDLRYLFTKTGITDARLSPEISKVLDGSDISDWESQAFESDSGVDKKVTSSIASLHAVQKATPTSVPGLVIEIQLKLRDIFLKNPTVANALRCLELIPGL